jgi:hypothetical protein
MNNRELMERLVLEVELDLGVIRAPSSRCRFSWLF